MPEITKFTKKGGPLTKRIELTGLDQDEINSDAGDCRMSIGTAERLRLNDLEELGKALEGLKENQAIALGTLSADLPKSVGIVTQGELNKRGHAKGNQVTARSADSIYFEQGRAAFSLVDYDTKGILGNIKAAVDDLGGLWEALATIVPELAKIGRLTRASTSSGLRNTETCEPIRGSDGLHLYVLVLDGTDNQRFLRALHERCWLAGFGWHLIGRAGQLLERSLIDRMVYAPERLIFEASPILGPSLAQDKESRRPVYVAGEMLDTRRFCPDLTFAERQRAEQLKRKSEASLKVESDSVREGFICKRAQQLSKRVRCTQQIARRTIEHQINGTLRPAVKLAFDDPDIEGRTVGHVLADPDRYLGETLADPIEGISYGRGKAKIFERADGTLWINSFAHGRTTYELKHDASTLAEVFAKLDEAEPIERFARLLVDADLAPDEAQRLSDNIKDLKKTSRRAVNLALKQVRDQRVQQLSVDLCARAVSGGDVRAEMPVPLPDAERLPILAAIDQALSTSQRFPPPLRDLDGHPVEIQRRQPRSLHALTAESANGAELTPPRLPPPEHHLITRHNKLTMALEIEDHLHFRSKNGASVALPVTFVEHYLEFRSELIPKLSSVMIIPVVNQRRELLGSSNLSQELSTLFRVPAEISLMLSALGRPTRKVVAEALRYLVDEWLVDVSADFDGKVVLISLALTIIERVLLPERPLFFVTAGKRGGGKTTAATMIALAVTGTKPAAAAWSFQEEERRKSMLAYLAEGLPVLFWDNIKSGQIISCPTLEKVATSETYSDRVLGASAFSIVSAQTVMVLTGNNIAPKGDLSSRSLVARLNVDRADPENREFIHQDPIGWTMEHRAQILKALYTILLASQSQAASKTRFKVWWKLVGAPLERAAADLATLQKDGRAAGGSAKPVDFGQLFAKVEEEDEESDTVAGLLEVLGSNFLERDFQSTDVKNLLSRLSDDQNEEDLAILEEFFDPQKRGIRSVSSKSIGKRLKSILDAPVETDNGLMKLVAEHSSFQSKRSATYRICWPKSSMDL